MITLYTVPSANGYRASIMLEECGLPYETVIVDAKNAAHKRPDFLAISPIGKMPAIVDDAPLSGPPVAMSETLAIALYACEKSGLMMPASPHERARALQWGAIVSSGFAASFTMIFFGKRFDEAGHAGIIAKGEADLAACLAGMEATLARTPYLAGQSYSFADALAVPITLIQVERFAIDLALYPAIADWHGRVSVRPQVQRGMDYGSAS